MAGTRSSLACLALASAAFLGVGCGGGETRHDVNPVALLDAGLSHPIPSASVNTDIGLQVSGVPQLARPATLRLEGPYVSGHGERIPSFDWKLNASVAGFPVDGQLVSTGENLFLSVYGDNYEVGRAAVAAANQRVAAGFGLHPRRWLGPPRYEGDEDVGGVDTAHLVSDVRGARAGQDLQGFFTSLGLSHPPAIHGTAETWVGIDDQVIRKLKLDALVTIPPPARPRLGGAGEIHLNAEITAEDVGESQTIRIPAGGGFRPIRDLFLSLNDLGVPGLSSLGLL
jgi:hypothetical protein